MSTKTEWRKMSSSETKTAILLQVFTNQPRTLWNWTFMLLGSHSYWKFNRVPNIGCPNIQKFFLSAKVNTNTDWKEIDLFGGSFDNLKHCSICLLCPLILTYGTVKGKIWNVTWEGIFMSNVNKPCSVWVRPQIKAEIRGMRGY